MIYGNSVDQVRGMIGNKIAVFRLAKVTAFSGGYATVQLYGDGTPSSKHYPVIEGYKPSVGDDVLMCVQGSTMVVVGKILKTAITEDNIFLKKADADNLYVTTAEADERYAQKPVYELERQSHKFTMDTSGHLTGSSNVTLGESSSSPFGEVYTTGVTLANGGDITAATTGSNVGSSSRGMGTVYTHKIVMTSGSDAASIEPATDTTPCDLGTSTKRVRNGYFTNVYCSTRLGNSGNDRIDLAYIKQLGGSDGLSKVSSAYINNAYITNVGDSSHKADTGFFTAIGSDSATGLVDNLYLSNATVYGTILAKANYATSIGTENTLFQKGYFDTLGANSAGKSVQTLNVKNIKLFGNTTVNYNKTYDIGTSSYMLRNVYAEQYYQNGTAISTSDKRKKTGIKDLAKKYVEFFKKLRPRSFRFKDGESGRTHTGFVAQEVEEAAQEAGIDNKDLAFICIDENGDYGLRYEELISIQTKVIQDLLTRVEDLERRVK